MLPNPSAPGRVQCTSAAPLCCPARMIVIVTLRRDESKTALTTEREEYKQALTAEEREEDGCANRKHLHNTLYPNNTPPLATETLHGQQFS